MKIIKGTVDSKILKLAQPDAIKVVNSKKSLGIVGGEFAITFDQDDIPISTLLGSCVSVMVYDKVLKIKGMNHFLLPTSCSSNGSSCRFGLNAMEVMLNEMYKLGSKKENLSAKIAGGATMIKNLTSNIGEQNVSFARHFCSIEKIPIVAQSVFGNNGRVIMLDSDFNTFTKTVINSSMGEQIAKADRSFAEVANKTEEIFTQDTILF